MQFKEISIKNLPEMKAYLKKAGNPGCNYSAGNLIIWGADLDISYTIAEGTIVFRTLEEEKAIYHIAGYTDTFALLIRQLTEDAASLRRHAYFADLSREMAEALEEAYPDLFRFRFNRDGSDYVYEVSALASLSGKKYHKKKNHVNRFKKSQRFVYEPLTLENIPECRKMAEEWREGKEMNASLEAEARALERAFQYYEELGFTGGLLRVDGKVAAFTLGEALSGEMFVTHFEKALDYIPELYAVINQQFAEHALSGYHYVNREEDLGVEGLRKAKTSYHPVFMVEKYGAELKEEYNSSRLCLWCCEFITLIRQNISCKIESPPV